MRAEGRGYFIQKHLFSVILKVLFIKKALWFSCCTSLADNFYSGVA